MLDLRIPWMLSLQEQSLSTAVLSHDESIWWFHDSRVYKGCDRGSGMASPGDSGRQEGDIWSVTAWRRVGVGSGDVL